jgi:prophage antirepressor-like protein
LTVNKLRVFDFDEQAAVRTAVADDDEPLVCAADLIRALRLKCPQSVYRQVENCYKLVLPTLTSGGPREMVFLREPGVHQLLASVRLPKPGANRDRIEAIQRWLLDIVLPQIRRPGSCVPVTAAATTSPISYAAIEPEFAAAMGIARLFGLEGDQVPLTANRGMKTRYGVDVLAEFQLPLPSPDDEPLFTPTELGARLGLSAREVNLRLATLGLQKRDATGNWRLTEDGKKYGVSSDVNK